MRQLRRGSLVATGLLVLTCSLAQAQGIGGGGGGGFTGSSGGGGFTGSGGGGGFTGSSGGGGFTGSSGGGGFTGSSGGGGFNGTGGGGFTGTAGGGLGGPTGGQFGVTSTRGANYVANSVFGKYMGNPLALGVASGTLTNSAASNYARAFPVRLTFGTPLYSTANVTTTNITNLGNLSRTNTTASSAGVRRAPGYLTEIAFDRPVMTGPALAARMETRRADLQDVISRSSRLASRGNIQVMASGETIILRGQVQNDRERRMAEAVLRLSPGIREIRNELTVPTGGKP